MALISPILDNRTFEQLRDELVKRIPVYTPEWTDHNESDPGIALLELLAYLGESLLFRFNQIPDTTKVGFLRLLGVQPRTAQPAHVLVVARTDVPQGVQILSGTEARAGSVRFQTEDETYAWPLDVVAVGKVAAPGAVSKADTERRRSALAYEKLTAAKADFYETVAVPADPLAAGAAPLDVSTTLDQSLWIALLRKPTTNVATLKGTLFVGVAFDEQLDLPFALQNLNAPQAEQFRSTGLGADPPPMLWQLWNGETRPKGALPYTTLDVLADTTGGLIRSGVVKVALPERLPAIDPDATARGGTDSPPPLTDDQQAKRVIGWLRVTRPNTENDAIHRVRWVGLNAVSAVQAASAGPELLGTGSGDAGQQFPLAQHPVLAGTVRVQVEEADGWHDWQEVPDFIASGADDRHVSLDYAAGTVLFGTRRVPQLGERIRALRYRYGGGLVGNVGPASVTSITLPAGAGAVQVSNPLPAVGGADTVSLVDALDAIPAEIHRHDRAVIADDFRELALQVTGVKRAETLPLLHPDTPNVDAAGVVSVVIFPEEDLRAPSAPTPDLGLLRRVAVYLDRRRLITTELYAIPPTYRKIVVSVGVQVRDGYQVDAVRRWVELIVRQYLAPLPPFGPDGGGWPLGRTVRRAELEAVAVQVQGVEYITGLVLGVPNGTGTGFDAVPLVTLERWEVPELTEITVVAGDPLPLGEPVEGPEPDKVPVPLPPEVC
jgi:predicted phage baseplate assembly protein